MKVLAVFLLAIGLRAATAPMLHLGDNVRPLRYAIDLTLSSTRDTFRGAADEEIEILQPTNLIWINATALTIQRATFGDTAAEIVSGNNNVLGLSFAAPVSGRGTLRFEYEGKISRNSSAGLFELQDNGEWYLYSQFEPTDARRAFPCFDEPRFKAPWQLTLHVPKDQRAFSNTPVQSETAEPNGQKAVRFQSTKPLPSYLVALAVGNFDVVDAGKVGNTPLRIITPHGRGKEAAFAKASIAPLLKVLENYFGMPYPYEKLDSVAMPVSNFAMENAGLITYGSSDLLSKSENDTFDRQRSFAYTAAHEMAHQWFGDLVTMQWWDDTWLNEAFATWMERKAVHKWKPDWHVEVTEVNARLGAMGLDSLVSARQIRQPIESDSDIADAFDGITYEKGAAVIRMFETWLGEEPFRKGVQRYLKQHAWGNATASDFEAAISQSVGRDIAPAFNSFIEQPGVPELTVYLDCTAKKPKLVMTQKRSLPIGSEGSVDKTWKIPVCVAYGGGEDMLHQCAVLAEPKSEMVLNDAKSCPAWLLANDNESGYYRVSYSGDLLNQLLSEGLIHLRVAEAAGVLGDTKALVNTGDVSPATALALVPRFADSPERLLAESAMSIAELVKGRTVPDDMRPNAARYIRATFGARARQLGWTPSPGEHDDQRLLRESIVPFVAGEGQDEQLGAQAKALAQTWLKNHRAIAPSLVQPVLEVAAEHGDAQFFEQLRAAARAEQVSRLREQILSAMGSFRDPAIASRGMDLLLSGEFDMREAFFPLLFGPLSYTETRDLPFAFIRKNIDALLTKLPRETGEDFAAQLPAVGSAFCDAGHRSEVQSFFDPRVKDYAGGPRALAHVLETIDLCTAQAKVLGPEYASFLNKY